MAIAVSPLPLLLTAMMRAHRDALRCAALLPSLRVADQNQPTTEDAEDEATELGTPFLEVCKGMPAARPVRLQPDTFVLGRDATADVT